MYTDFIKLCLTYGANIIPLEVQASECNSLGLCNPSVFIDGDTIRIILRNVNYVLWASVDEHYMSTLYGPLYYITPDDDLVLRTQNFIGELTKDGNVEYKKIDTSKCDWEPKWEFVGHEDMRLVRWDGKLYGTGVQRDWNISGKGRMHLSEINPDTGEELSRVRIEAPNNKDSYCEKNWMPILDMPYHYVKWCNPLEIVKVNPNTGDSETVLLKEYSEDTPNINIANMSIRGSSQIVTWGEYRIAIVHICSLDFNDKKQKSNPLYLEQFIVWDKDWNIVKITEPFKFANFNIEFTNGLAYKDGSFYIPFALQDNIAFMVQISDDVIKRFIFDEDYSFGDYYVGNNTYLDFFNDSTNSKYLVALGDEYYRKRLLAGACVCYERACDYNTFETIDELYAAIYMTGLCIAKLGHRDEMERCIWMKLINMCPERSEGYLMMARYCSWRDFVDEAYMFAKIAYEKNNYKYIGKYSDIENSNDGFVEYITDMYWTEEYNKCESTVQEYMKTHMLSLRQSVALQNLLKIINTNKGNRKRVL